MKWLKIIQSLNLNERNSLSNSTRRIYYPGWRRTGVIQQWTQQQSRGGGCSANCVHFYDVKYIKDIHVQTWPRFFPFPKDGFLIYITLMTLVFAWWENEREREKCSLKSQQSNVFLLISCSTVTLLTEHKCRPFTNESWACNRQRDKSATWLILHSP